jgi:hypothetical protein
VNARNESRLVGKVMHVDSGKRIAYVRPVNGMVLPVAMNYDKEFTAEDVVLVARLESLTR